MNKRAELNKLLDKLIDDVIATVRPEVGPPGPEYFRKQIECDRRAIIKLFREVSHVQEDQ